MTRIIRLFKFFVVNPLNKKAQPSGSAAALVIGIIALLIVFYILFLPPEDRAALLGEPYNPGGSSSSGSTSGEDDDTIDVDTSEPILIVSPGLIDWQALDEYEYTLPSFTIKKTSSDSVLTTISNFYVRNGWFDKQTRNYTFEIDDLDNTENVLLSLVMAKKKGRLIIQLNGNEIYNFEPSQLNIEPIELSPSILKEGQNTLEFRVSDVGMEFWTTNEYSIENLKITASIYDVSRTEARNYFYITEEEGENIDAASLKFNPDCRISEAGYLDVFLNGVQVFSGIPDCGILNTYHLSPNVLNIGKNSLKFTTDDGSYLIDQISVNTKLEEPVHPTYYFELDEDLFYSKKSTEIRCGDYDGKCPDDCDEDIDYDCCQEEYSDSYWCDVPTSIEDDRCVGFVTGAMCERCPSGYEDDRGRAADDCEDLCGDDNDGECPAGCVTYYDKDCCFDLSGDQYWCEDLPITGAAFACVSEVSQNNCRNCPTGYQGEGSDPDCDDVSNDQTEDRLRKDYSIILEFEFTERGNDKEAKMWINNHETGFDTRESKWMKNIDAFVEPDTNSIKLIPKSELEIKEIKVYFD